MLKSWQGPFSTLNLMYVASSERAICQLLLFSFLLLYLEIVTLHIVYRHQDGRMILVFYLLCYYVAITKLWYTLEFQDPRTSLAWLTLVTALV